MVWENVRNQLEGSWWQREGSHDYYDSVYKGNDRSNNDNGASTDINNGDD